MKMRYARWLAPIIVGGIAGLLGTEVLAAFGFMCWFFCVAELFRELTIDKRGVK